MIDRENIWFYSNTKIKNEGNIMYKSTLDLMKKTSDKVSDKTDNLTHT